VGHSATFNTLKHGRGRFVSMSVVHITSYRRRGGLRRDQVWVERAFPDRHWVIAEVFVGEHGQRRVVIEPVEDRTSEAVYSETYFRRHFVDRHSWLRRENERLLRQAQRKEPAQVLHEMVRYWQPAVAIHPAFGPKSTGAPPGAR